MRVLNLYAGIGGNRKLWTDCEVTAVEYRQDIANVYKHYFPGDNVIIADAHQYLLNHYQEFDFIWTSPPCQTHSRSRMWGFKNNEKVEKKYPDMRLYEEIIFLQSHFEGKWTVENVKPYYDVLIPPTREFGRHLFWSNFYIPPPCEIKEADVRNGKAEDWIKLHGFDLSGFKLDSRKDQIYRNCVHPETGLLIFNCVNNIYRAPTKQLEMFA